MGLMDVLRKAEEQSKNAARRGKELARATLNESGRMMRRKMRVNPPAVQARVSAAETEADGTAQQPQQLQSRPGEKVQKRELASAEFPRKKIISINGKDVRTEEVAPPSRRTA